MLRDMMLVMTRAMMRAMERAIERAMEQAEVDTSRFCQVSYEAVQHATTWNKWVIE